MSTLSLNTTVPLSDDWDVLVCGGGPAGCMAAASAAREGARTLLIEGTGCLGGMGTSGMVPGWCGFADGEKLIHRGLADRVRKGLYGDAWQDISLRVINSELLKRLYDDIVRDEGVEVLLQTSATRVIMGDDGTVDTVLISNKAGLSAVKARVVVDCTGDGDIAAWAGSVFRKGDETGDMQPVTHCLALSGAAHDYRDKWPEGDFMGRAIEDPNFPLVKGTFLGTGNPLVPGTHGLNSGHIWGVDGTDPRSLTHALMYGRAFAAQQVEALARHFPAGFADAFLVATGPLLGVRETRRIVGDYELTVEDHQQRRSFPDEIARSAFWTDVHDAAHEDPGANRIRHERSRYEPGESHGIPYRILTPKKLKNVLVAGRCASSDRLANGAIRVMPPCMSMGEAAGMAAAHAARDDADVHAVNTDTLRERLCEEGAFLPEAPVTSAVSE